MANAQINPLLIEVLTGKDAGEFPGIDSLPGTYVKAIYENKDKIDPEFDEDRHTLRCKSCGRKGNYDVGMIFVNPEEARKSDRPQDSIQMTGYFRCKHCNDAGNWELPNRLWTKAIVGSLAFLQGAGPSGNVAVGGVRLFDGTSHCYATGAEDHLLQKLKDHPEDAYLWNRLGNLYRRGNRPELAACVFEHSIKLDPKQVESLYTLGEMLGDIGDFSNAGYYFRQMLLYAREYKKMPAEKLREALAYALQFLFMVHDDTEGKIPFLPTEEEREAAGFPEAESGNIVLKELEIVPADAETFYPIAEMYMGPRAKEIPLRKRTLDAPKAPNAPKKKKKRKKRK